MNWPFHNYTPSEKTLDRIKEERARAKASAAHSARRQSKLDSDDPKVRAQAVGDLGPLSGFPANTRLLKNSRLG